MMNPYKIYDRFFNSKYTNKHLIGNNRSYQKFILLTYRRTGANYFLDMLRSHPAIIAFATMLEEGRTSFIYPGYPSPYCKRTIQYRNKYPIDFIDSRVFGNYSKDIDAVGFKIVYETGFPFVLDYLLKQPDVKFIHLQRRNTLRLYLSDMIATKTNVWGAVTKENEYLFKNNKAESFTKVVEKKENRILPDGFTIKLDYNECLKEFIKINEFANKYKNCFASDRIINIYYEDLLINLDEELIKVQDFLGVDYHSLSSRFIKINNSKLSDIIENYAELKGQFAESEWAVFFDE